VADVSGAIGELWRREAVFVERWVGVCRNVCTGASGFLAEMALIAKRLRRDKKRFIMNVPGKVCFFYYS
jgi:hypothetical protein